MQLVNQLPALDVAGSPTGCCARFEPAAWDGQIFQFDDKLFVKVVTHSFMYMPLNMGAVMKKTMQAIEAAGAAHPTEHITLSYDATPWTTEHYIAVTKDVPGAHMVRLSGTYITKVFEGSFRNAGEWYDELVDYATAKGEELVKIYFFYTTCPRCAKVYGKNYVVGFAQVETTPVT